MDKGRLTERVKALHAQSMRQVDEGLRVVIDRHAGAGRVRCAGCFEGRPASLAQNVLR